MANADMALQAESTTYQGQVHDDKPAPADKWAAATIDAVLRLHALTLAAGCIPQQPVRAWLDARREVHEALDKTVQAVQFGAVQWANASIGQVTPREDQAAQVLEREGWAWATPGVPGVGWTPPAAHAARVAHKRAADCLIEMGWKWSTERTIWLAPILTKPMSDEDRARAKAVQDAAQAVLNAAAAGPLGVELAERLHALNAAVGNPPCVYRAGPEPMPLSAAAVRAAAEGVLTAAKRGLLTADMATSINTLSRELGHKGPIFPTPYPTNGEQGAGWPEGAAADLVRSLGYEWDGSKWQNRKPAPSVLDQPLGVQVVIGRGSVDAAKFGADQQVRSLVEHGEHLHHKVYRLEYAAKCARDKLANSNDIDAALQHLRSVV